MQPDRAGAFAGFQFKRGMGQDRIDLEAGKAATAVDIGRAGGQGIADVTGFGTRLDEGAEDQKGPDPTEGKGEKGSDQRQTGVIGRRGRRHMRGPVKQQPRADHQERQTEGDQNGGLAGVVQAGNRGAFPQDGFAGAEGDHAQVFGQNVGCATAHHSTGRARCAVAHPTMRRGITPSSPRSSAHAPPAGSAPEGPCRPCGRRRPSPPDPG